MKRIPLHFLPVQVPGAKPSKRETELSISKAKAHTSRVSHPRQRTKRQLKPYVAIAKPIEQDKLDPFIQLVINLPPEDRNLLQYYLTTKPSSLYGTSGQSPFCPVRDAAIPFFKDNAIYIHWHLLLSESTDNARDVRRGKIYKLMRELVNDKKNLILDSTIFTLAASGICENRSKTAFGKTHLTAVVRLLQLRHGLRTIQEMSWQAGSTVFAALVMWEKELAVTKITIPRGRELPPALKQYFLAGNHGIGLKAQLANLHCMNGILERDEGTAILKDLECTLQPTMPPHTVLCAICRCAQRVGYWETDLIRTWEAIEFVEVVQPLKCAEWVEAVMSGWLTSSKDVTVQEVISEIETQIRGQEKATVIAAERDPG